MDEVKKKGAVVDGHKLVMTFIFVAVTAVIFLGIGFMAGKNSAGTSEVAVVSESATATTGTAVGTPVTDEETIICNQIFPGHKVGPLSSNGAQAGEKYCTVESVVGNFARGNESQVIDGSGGPGAGFIAAKVNKSWVKVQSSQDSWSCSTLRKYNVPRTMLENDGTCVNDDGQAENY